MFLLIDNYDSFTYNLYHYFLQSGVKKVEVVRNDKISINEINKLNPSAIILSPGPCTPNEAGICLDAIKNFAGKIPIFGVCLGHQSIGQAFGGKIIKHQPMHGKVSNIYHNQHQLFYDMPNPFSATRYHSLIIDSASCPSNLKIIAHTAEEIIMAIADDEKKIYGVQFHPESIATENGLQIIKNFVSLVKK
jgi:anthranilate synthase/aminodeoxychorismate synthase-like glutamine amidotransferase